MEEVEGASPATAYLARIRADTYKWRAAVQAPREWSERQGPEVQVNVGLDIATLHLELLRHRSHDAVELSEAKRVLDRPAE